MLSLLQVWHTSVFLSLSFCIKTACSTGIQFVWNISGDEIWSASFTHLCDAIRCLFLVWLVWFYARGIVAALGWSRWCSFNFCLNKACINICMRVASASTELLHHNCKVAAKGCRFRLKRQQVHTEKWIWFDRQDSFLAASGDFLGNGSSRMWVVSFTMFILVQVCQWASHSRTGSALYL